VTAWQFLRHGNLHLERNPSVIALQDKYDLLSRHGHLLPYFPWPTMLFALPGDLLARLAGKNPATLSIVDPGRTFLIEIPTASLLVALTAAMIRQLVLDDEGPWASRRTANWSAVAFAFTTSAWSVGSRALWQQTVSMFLIVLTLLVYRRLDRGAGYRYGLGVLLVLGPICRPTDSIFTVLFLVMLIYKRQVSKEIILGLLVPFAIFVAYSHTQYGGVLPPYYSAGREAHGGKYGFFDGLALNLVSPSRGLILFDPIVVLSLLGAWYLHRRRSLSALHAVLIAAVVFQWLLLAEVGSTGGDVYGPRLFLDDVPILVLLAVPALSCIVHPPSVNRTAWFSSARAAGSALLVAGFLVNATGALMRSSRCWNITPSSVDARPGRVWAWSDAQFLWSWKQLARTGSVHAVEAPRCDL
jgi:hypothetical protein